jgi:hypothetical protein
VSCAAAMKVPQPVNRNSTMKNRSFTLFVTTLAARLGQIFSTTKQR